VGFHLLASGGWKIATIPSFSHPYGYVTVPDFLVTAVCANNLPFIVAPVPSVIPVLAKITFSNIHRCPIIQGSRDNHF